MGRTHVVMDDALLAAIDAVAGHRGRSRFLEEAAQEKLARMELEAALRDSAGAVSGEDHPEWADRERAAQWVRAQRGAESAA